MNMSEAMKANSNGIPVRKIKWNPWVFVNKHGWVQGIEINAPYWGSSEDDGAEWTVFFQPGQLRILKELAKEGAYRTAPNDSGYKTVAVLSEMLRLVGVPSEVEQIRNEASWLFVGDKYLLRVKEISEGRLEGRAGRARVVSKDLEQYRLIKPGRYRELRERKGLTLREFAKRIGVSPTYVSQMETGEIDNIYSRQTTMRIIGTLELNKAEAEEILKPYRLMALAELTCIDECIANVPEVKE